MLITDGWLQPTMDYGTSCVEPSDPWIGRCKYDVAFDLLQHIYADLVVNISL